jgi:lipopolysaccharide transport system ATP-binding protein
MALAIRAAGLSKAYRIRSARRGTYKTLREEVGGLASRWVRGSGTEKAQTIWALENVSFDVDEGQIVGVIGRNGAGKSTLLKILSRITEPTRGHIDLWGRVGALLEVGTGFHPELTGRENVFLSGALLGMRHHEIARRFDEIVAFAEVEEFVDTPVKRYSSGMYMRLAFAVAAHLDPEILVVDEVLAVGDVAFQRKCLGQMNRVARSGRTVLFVSHNMAAVASLCTRAMVLRGGHRVFGPGDVQDAIRTYLDDVATLGTTRLADRIDRQGEGQLRVTDLEILDGEGKRASVFISGQPIEFRLKYESRGEAAPRNVAAAISVSLQAGSFLTMLYSEAAMGVFPAVPPVGTISCTLDRLPLTQGAYTLNVTVRTSGVIQDWVQEAAVLNVDSGDFFGTGRLIPQSHQGVLVDQRWRLDDGDA